MNKYRQYINFRFIVLLSNLKYVMFKATFEKFEIDELEKNGFVSIEIKPEYIKEY